MNKKIGILAGIIASCTFGGTAVWCAMIFEMGVDSMLLIVLRNLLALPFLYVMMKFSKVSLAISKKQFWDMFWLSMIGFGPTCMLVFFAYEYIPVGHTTVIHFLYPVMAMVIGILCFKEKATKHKMAALVLCTIGIFWFMPTSESLEATAFIGIGLAFLSAVAYGGYLQGIAHSSWNTEHALKVTFYLNIMSSAQPALYSISQGNFNFDFEPIAWVHVTAIAVLVSVVGFFCMQLAVEKTDAVTASVLFTLEPISAVVSGIILLSEPLTLATVLGIVFILGSCIVIALDPTPAKVDKEQCA